MLRNHRSPRRLLRQAGFALASLLLCALVAFGSTLPGDAPQARAQLVASPTPTATAAAHTSQAETQQDFCPGAFLLGGALATTLDASLPASAPAYPEAQAVRLLSDALAGGIGELPAASLATLRPAQAGRVVRLPLILRPLNTAVEIVPRGAVQRAILPNSSVDFPLRLFNRGDVQTTIFLSFARRCAAGITGCTEGFGQASQVALFPGQFFDFTVNVFAPSAALGGQVGVSTVRAEVFQPAASNYDLDLTTLVQGLPPTPQPTATPRPTAAPDPSDINIELRPLRASVPRGGTVIFELRLQNRGDVNVNRTDLRVTYDRNLITLIDTDLDSGRGDWVREVTRDEVRIQFGRIDARRTRTSNLCWRIANWPPDGTLVEGRGFFTWTGRDEERRTSLYRVTVSGSVLAQLAARELEWAWLAREHTGEATTFQGGAFAAGERLHVWLRGPGGLTRLPLEVAADAQGQASLTLDAEGAGSTQVLVYGVESGRLAAGLLSP
jgi:hypothetical protein